MHNLYNWGNDMKKSKGIIQLAALTLGLTGIFGISSAEASTQYTIKKGDTLYRIADKNDLTVSQLKQLNNLSSSLIYPGNTLNIPTTVTVKKGDTLYSFAKKYKTTVSQLKFINKLSTNTIYVGDTLIIPTTVTVKKGDTLYNIANRYGLTVEELKTINYLTSDLIRVGQILNVAQAGTSSHIPASYDANEIMITISPKKGLTFAAEEPRRFILSYDNNGNYFSRIEVLDANANINEIKENSRAYLKGYTITEHPTKTSSHPFYRNAEFFLQGTSSKTQVNIVMKKVDGVWVRITIHYLNKEESEGITPKMIEALQTIKVR
ncbi:hypothetical protein CJ195_02985 [Bacillus sp. UMB0899]|nr:hypothetical protein CJ195_02985 [Bacillus sp. UMB0899]